MCLRRYCVDTSILKAIGFLNEMAEESKFGFKPFSSLKEEDDDTRGILFDDTVCSKRASGQIVYPDVIADYVLDENHHDVVSTWQDVLNIACGLNVAVIEQADGELWLEVTSDDDESLSISVEDGQWQIDTW